jgi:dipeptidyl-peptidase-4
MKINIITIVLLSLFTSVNAQLSNELIWSTGTFYPKNINGVNPISSGDYYTSLEKNNGNIEIVKYSYQKNKKIATLFSNTNFDNFKFSEYQISNDENWLLLSNSKESIYRRSSKSFYYLYNINKKTLQSLSDTSLGKQRLASFSPDNSKVAFVRDNNLYFSYLDNLKEITVTTSGAFNKIINGATDWVYEEEFSIHKGFNWSPDGSKIAYYVFDEENVKQFEMEMYGELYPSQYQFKYPKAGEANSKVSIKVYELDNKKHHHFNTGQNSDIYIPRMMWSKRNNELIVFKMNRLQNKLEILAGDIGDNKNPISEIKVRNIYSENSETYIDIHDNTNFINDDQFIWTSEKDGYNHIYLINYKEKTEEQLTKGNWEVTNVYGYSNNNKTIYFQAAKSSATDREIYSLNIENKKLKLLSESPGTNSASFSAKFNYFINTHSSANKPFTITLFNEKGQKIKVLENNKELIEKMNNYNLVDKTFFTIANNDGLNLNAWIMKPPTLDTVKKHPLLMFVYGGPGINTVNNKWSWMNYFWFQHLVQKGFVVVSVDSRGTGYRGKEFKHSTYLELGKLETEDQISSAIYLGGLNYVDKERIGIFGWSYGGYMSSLCITKGADVFNSAIAVAPVTNWRFYDNIYTERFMRTPKDNGENYDINSPINHVEKLKGNFLLIHGTADDNVHFQNSMEMVSEMVSKNKEFDFFAYPNKNHGIYGGYTRVHLYNKMTNFLTNHLLK